MEMKQQTLERHSTISTRANTRRECGRHSDESIAGGDLRDVEVLKPQPVRQDTRANLGGHHRKTRLDSQVSNPLPRILTVQSERTRSVSAAPGIEVLPPQQVPVEGPASPVKSRYKKVPRSPPEEQHPPPPAYPSRKTPTWTAPETHTPPPRRVTGTVEPNEDRPFPAAAPGGRGSPEGTLQRLKSDAAQSRDHDDPVRSGLIYARKDDYYPRLTSIVPEPEDDLRRPQPAPAERPDGASPNDARQQSFRRQTEARVDSRPHSPQAKPSFRRSSTQMRFLQVLRYK
jgi:hypothetical protein